MKIYDKTNFNELPKFFWKYWLKRIKKEIITTSHPLFIVRVGIGNENEEDETYKAMLNIKREKNDSTFCDFFYYKDKYIHIHLKTIFDYANMSYDDLMSSSQFKNNMIMKFEIIGSTNIGAENSKIYDRLWI